jgi:hypothetical protein
MGIVGGQLPRTAPFHGKEQRPSGSRGSHWSGDGSEQSGQGTSAQQCRRLVDSLQWGAQPVGAIAMTEWVRPPGGQLEGDPATEGVPGDVELQLSP